MGIYFYTVYDYVYVSQLGKTNTEFTPENSNGWKMCFLFKQSLLKGHVHFLGGCNYIYIYPGSPRPNKEWSLG